MDVVVDGERNFKVEGAPESVLAVVVAASEFLRGKHRAILVVEVDGEAIAPDDLVERLENTPLDSAGVLTITSEDVWVLATTCLNELDEVLPELPKACHSLAEVFQGADPETGYEPFHKLANIWRHIKVREAQVSHALNLDLDTLEANGTTVREMHEELNQYLAEAADALEAEDCVLLGDLLEYELAPRAEAEADIVALLRAKAAEQSN